MGVFIDRTGQRFGQLTAVVYTGMDVNHKSLWLWRCDCGIEKVTRSNDVVSGQIISCGCFQRQHAGDWKRVHPKHNKRTYRSWRGMHARCTNPKRKAWINYGGRGITVCERWQTFAHFYADMGDPPEGMSIERIDVNGNYEKENCRWATAREQARNRRNNRRITYGGHTRLLVEWAEELGMPASRLRERLYHLGWPVEEALYTPCTEAARRKEGVILQ